MSLVRTLRSVAAAVLGAALGAAAVLAQNGAAGRVEVEVWSGIEALPDPAEAGPEVASVPLHVVVDLTPSMADDVRDGATALEAARTGAEDLLRALPVSESVTVHVLGALGGAGSACAPAARTAYATGADAALYVHSAPSHSEASLAETLQGVAADLDGRPARVVALTDLDTACGGDLCAAVKALDEAGGSLDLVVLADRPAPACLAGGRGDPTPVPAAAPAVRHPRFRVVSWPPDQPGPSGEATAGFGSVGVPAGSRVAVIVETDPPLQLGPLEVASGERLQIRILDFPVLGTHEAFVRGARWAARGEVEPGP